MRDDAFTPGLRRMSSAIDQVLLRGSTDGDLAVMADALRAGADPNAKIETDEEGGRTSALLSAVQARRHAAVALLLKSGADPHVFEGSIMAKAIRRRDLEMCRLLLAAGARPQMAPGDDYFLHRALNQRDPAMVHLLLAAGAPIGEPRLRRELTKMAEAAGDADLVARVSSAPERAAEPEATPSVQ